MRHKTLLASILDGMALPGTIYEHKTIRRPAGTDLDRLRGDVMRVGQMFSTVMSRELERETSRAAETAGEPEPKRHKPGIG